MYLSSFPIERVLGDRILTGDPGFVNCGPFSNTESYLEVNITQKYSLKICRTCMMILFIYAGIRAPNF